MAVVFCNFRLYRNMRLPESEVQFRQRILIQSWNKLLRVTFKAFSLQPKIVVAVYY
jgi:hypothetical protein